MNCQHFNELTPDFPTLASISSKSVWACLSDGCFKINKHLTFPQLISACAKQSKQHSIMINFYSLEIFCTICNLQIFDNQDQEEIYQKEKKYKRMDPKLIRQFFNKKNPNQNQAIVFAGNPQYPPSFQKQKQGLCGLQNNTLNSYINSFVHLMSHIPIVTDIANSIAFQQIESRSLRYIFEIITTIWSGKYRIFKIDDLQRIMISDKSEMNCYSKKTPQNFLYFFLKLLLEQFSFIEVPCKSGQMTDKPFDEWQKTNRTQYTLLKQIFAGKCILQKYCQNCKTSTSSNNNFECLKVTFQTEQHHESSFKAELLALIEQAFNWRKTYINTMKKIEDGKFPCQKCNNQVKVYYHYVELPNHLIIQFGDLLDGLNVTLPQQIDLFQFTQDYVRHKAPNNRSAIYSYIGSIYKKDRNYITHIKHNLYNKQYILNDQLISQGQKSHLNVKLAVYKRITVQKNMSLYHNIASCLEVGVNPITPLPDFWSIYLHHCHNIPPLMNPFICQHGKQKHNLALSKMKSGPQKIPIEVYNYLLQIFGGRKITFTSDKQQCSVCLQKLNAICEVRASQKQMAGLADKFSNKKSVYYVNKKWLESWRKFAYEDNKKYYRTQGNPRPQVLGAEISGQKITINEIQYKKISSQVWYFLFKFYGKGPFFELTQKSIPPNSVVKASVNLRIQVLQKQLQLICSDCQKSQQIQLKQTKQQNNQLHEQEEILEFESN